MPPSDTPSLSSLELYKPCHELLRLVAEIDEFKGRWRGCNIAPSRLTALRQSSAIESEEALARFVECAPGGSTADASGYVALLETVFENRQHLALTDDVIRQLHTVLLTHSKTGCEWDCSSDTDRVSPELLGEIRQALAAGAIHPLIVIGAFVACILMTGDSKEGDVWLAFALAVWLLLRCGYDYIPYNSLESIHEEKREERYLALHRTQRSFHTNSPDWEPWLLFFVRTLHTQKVRLERQIRSEQLLEGDLPALSVRILEIARRQGRVKRAEIVALTGLKPGTIRNRLNELVERRLLNRHGNGPATWYTPTMEAFAAYE